MQQPDLACQMVEQHMGKMGNLQCKFNGSLMLKESHTPLSAKMYSPLWKCWWRCVHRNEFLNIFESGTEPGQPILKEVNLRSWSTTAWRFVWQNQINVSHCGYTSWKHREQRIFCGISTCTQNYMALQWIKCSFHHSSQGTSKHLTRFQ